MVEKHGFELKVQHFSSMHDCGDNLFRGAQLIKKPNIAKLMAHKALIVQMTHCFYYKI